MGWDTGRCGVYRQLSGHSKDMEMSEGTRNNLLHMIVAFSSSSPELLRFFFTRIVKSPADGKSPSALASTLAWILKCWRLQSPAVRGHSSGRNWESSVATTMNPVREICQKHDRSPPCSPAPEKCTVSSLKLVGWLYPQQAICLVV